MSLKFNIDATGIASAFAEAKAEVEADIKKAVKALSKMAHQRIVDQASNGPKKLHSSLSTYKENLSEPLEQEDGALWIITLDEPAMWIEDGIGQHDMKLKLLKGKNYQVIPFDQNKRPQDRTPTDENIMSELKTGLGRINRMRKKNGDTPINLNKIEKNSDGSPRIGKIHELEIDSSHPTAKAKHPALKGLTIYQSKDPTTGNIRKDVLTFRTVSVNSDPDSWIHPGFQAKKFFDEAYAWAVNEWETKILPEVLSNWSK